MAAGKSEYIKKAYEDLSRISADEEKRLEYEERERAIRDHQYFSTVYKNRIKRRLERRQKTGYGRIITGDGNEKTRCLCKDAGEISAFCKRSRTGSRKILEIISVFLKSPGLFYVFLS